MQTTNPAASPVVSPSSSADVHCARLGCGRDASFHGPEWASLPSGCPDFLHPEAAAQLPWVSRVDMPKEGSPERAASEVLTSYGYPLGVREARGAWGGPPAHNPFRFPSLVERFRKAPTLNALETWVEAHASAVSRVTGLTGGAALLADWDVADEVARGFAREEAARAEVQRKESARAGFKSALWDVGASVFPKKLVMDFVPPEDVPTWKPATAYRPCQRLTHAGREFVCWTGGTSGTSPTWETREKGGDCQDGAVTWRRLYALESARVWIRQVADGWAERAAPLLVLLGVVGGGKSSSGVVAAMEYALETCGTPKPFKLSAEDVVFWNAPEVARRGLYGPEVDAAVREACAARVLMIDDVGTEYATTAGKGPDAGNGPWLALLDEVINRRHQDCRLTLLTANVAPENFAPRYGQRIADRVKDGGRAVNIATASMRRERPVDAVARPILAGDDVAGADANDPTRPRVGFRVM